MACPQYLALAETVKVGHIAVARGDFTPELHSKEDNHGDLQKISFDLVGFIFLGLWGIVRY